MTNKNKNIYWNAACEVSELPIKYYGSCIVIYNLCGKNYSEEYFIYERYFKPSVKLAKKYDFNMLFWFTCYSQSEEQNQLDRFVALLLMHEIYNDHDFVEDPIPELILETIDL